MAQIVPGILTNDAEEYARRLRLAENVAPLVQIDVVDGKFSKNKTVGVDVIRNFPSKCLLEIQLMVVKPTEFIRDLDLDYVTRIIFPFECDEPTRDIAKKIKNLNKQAGISLNPDTNVDSIQKYANDLDLLLLMTGRPGYSGQQLGVDTYDRIQLAKNIAPGLPLEIDIGVNLQNAKKLARAGADYLVASSALYDTGDFANAYIELAKEGRLDDNYR